MTTATTQRRITLKQAAAGGVAILVALMALSSVLPDDDEASGMEIVRNVAPSAPPCRPVSGVFASRLASETGLSLDDVRSVRDESRTAAWYVAASVRGSTGTVPALFATNADPSSPDPEGTYRAVNPVAKALTDLRSGDSLGFSAEAPGGRQALSCVTG